MHRRGSRFCWYRKDGTPRYPGDPDFQHPAMEKEEDMKRLQVDEKGTLLVQSAAEAQFMAAAAVATPPATGLTPRQEMATRIATALIAATAEKYLYEADFADCMGLVSARIVELINEALTRPCNSK